MSEQRTFVELKGGVGQWINDELTDVFRFAEQFIFLTGGLDNNDEVNRKKLRGKCFIAGGAIVSYLCNEQPNDYDVFITDRDVVTKIINAMSNNGKRFYPQVVNVTKNAVTLHHDGNVIQIVTKDFGFDEPFSIEQIVETFDFIHPMCFWNPLFNHTLCNTESLAAIAMRQLRFNENHTITNPISQLIRMMKFIDRGWTINNADLAKIALAIAKCGRSLEPADYDKMLALVNPLFEAGAHQKNLDNLRGVSKPIDHYFYGVNQRSKFRQTEY